MVTVATVSALQRISQEICELKATWATRQDPNNNNRDWNREKDVLYFELKTNYLPLDKDSDTK